MKTFKTRLVAGVLLGLLSSSIASAHHSYSMFDREKKVAVSGVVSEWNWTNPHISLLLTGDPDGKGKVLTYTFEGSSPAVLRGMGWSRAMVKPGDHVSVTMYPFRDGSAGGQVFSVTAVDGHVFAMVAP